MAVEKVKKPIKKVDIPEPEDIQEPEEIEEKEEKGDDDEWKEKISEGIQKITELLTGRQEPQKKDIVEVPVPPTPKEPEPEPEPEPQPEPQPEPKKKSLLQWLF